MPTVQYFEIPVDDMERAQKFYKQVFGWDMQKWDNKENPEQEYYMFETRDEKGNPGLGGGMMKRQSPQHPITNYITVSSIDEYTSKIEQSGGMVMVPKTNVPDMGFIAVCLDSENNVFGIFETTNPKQ
ncbi:MAG: VOC family protein [Nitrosopumilus sp.]|nr:VOC family protein [Nitrosopumilus sp.]